MLNKVILMGRLTRDPELRRTSSGAAVASFTLAVDRDFSRDGGEREVDFIDCVAWRGSAEVITDEICFAELKPGAGSAHGNSQAPVTEDFPDGDYHGQE